MPFFSAQTEYSYFPADFRLKIFLLKLNKHLLSLSVRCTVYRTVISSEHLGLPYCTFFLLLLASFAVYRKEINNYQFSLKHIIAFY